MEGFPSGDQPKQPGDSGLSQYELDLIRFDGESGHPRSLPQASGEPGPADAPRVAEPDPGQLQRFEDDGGPVANAA